MARLEKRAVPGTNQTNTVRVYFILLEGNSVTFEWMEVDNPDA